MTYGRRGSYSLRIKPRQAAIFRAQWQFSKLVNGCCPLICQIQRSLGAVLLTSGEAKRAVAAYRSAGLTGATSGDYVAAIGASLGAQEAKLADQWLKEGLMKFPTDHESVESRG